MTQEQAFTIAKPHLEKDEVAIVHVNQHGLYWINSDEATMDEYFKRKKENYFVFKSEVVEQPETSDQEEGDKPKTKRKK